MLRACLPSVFLLATACADQPDFDSRYEEAEQSIAEKAEAMDAELAAPAEANTDPPSSADEDKIN